MTEFAINVRDIGLERLAQHRQAQQSVSRRLTTFSEKLVVIASLIGKLGASRSEERGDVDRRIAPIVSAVKQQMNLRSKLNRVDRQLDDIIARLTEMTESP